MLRQSVVVITTAFVCASCSSSSSSSAGGGGGMKDPPQVFLTASETNNIGLTLKLRANVSGCEKVRGIEIYNNTTRIISYDNPAKVPYEIELTPTLFDPLYNSLGIALNLTLRARGICDDGRENKSSGLGLSFFPVEAVVAPLTGNSTALPDSFIAEGGVGGTPTTFIGCVGLSTGKTGLARFDTMGNVIGANTMPPVECSYSSTITDKNTVTGLRWLFEPGVGAYAFDSKPNSALNITTFQKAPMTHIGVGPDGDAILNNPTALPTPLVFRVPSGVGSHAPWGAELNGIMIADPVVSQGEVRVASWVGSLGVFAGEIHVTRFNYDNGVKLSESKLASIEFGEFNTPIVPSAFFSKDGKVLYFAFQNQATGHTTSGVVACASDSSTGCFSGAAGSWQSPTLDAVITAAVPFAGGTMIAAISGTKTYFLSAANGQIMNAYNYPIKPDGTLLTFGAQPGNGTDFYLLNGPKNGSYPTEIIAVDSPQNGELWRMQIEGGQTPQTAVNIAIDDGNNAWLRVGSNLVKPSALAQYRLRKGTNPQPPDGGE